MRIKDFILLAELSDLIFGGWDVYEDNVFEAATKAKVLERMLLQAVKDGLLPRLTRATRLISLAPTPALC